MTSRARSTRAAEACASAFRALLPSSPDRGFFHPSADVSCVEIGYCGKALPVNGGPGRPNGAPAELQGGSIDEISLRNSRRLPERRAVLCRLVAARRRRRGQVLQPAVQEQGGG